MEPSPEQEEEEKPAEAANDEEKKIKSEPEAEKISEYQTTAKGQMHNQKLQAKLSSMTCKPIESCELLSLTHSLETSVLIGNLTDQKNWSP